MNDDDRIKLVYPATIALLNQAETTTSARLGNFLTASGFMTAAYTLAATETGLRVSLALAGICLSILYALVMRRSRAYVEGYVDYGKKLEDQLAPGDGTKGVLIATQVNEGLRGTWIAIWLPIGFGALHAVLFVSTLQ